LPPAVDEYAHAVAERLGALAHAVYVQGSIALGGYDARASDVDMLAVVGEPLARVARGRARPLSASAAIGASISGLDLGYVQLMKKEDIIAKIRVAIPDARVELRDLTGTEDHWDATVVSAAFAGK